jgi:hypothetical protein
MAVLRSVLATLRDCGRSRAILQLEILALRHQLQVVERSRRRPVRLTRCERTLWVWFFWFSRLRWRSALVIVKPETVISLASARVSLVVELQEPTPDGSAGSRRVRPRCLCGHLARHRKRSGEGRTFPMTREVREVLEQQRTITENLQRQLKVVCLRVFHRPGRPIKGFRVVFRSACKEAGCPGRVLHDFRRTAVRNLVRAGILERVAMQMTRPKTRSAFERYNIVSVGDLCEAARRGDIAAGTISGRSSKSAIGVESLKFKSLCDNS